MGFALTVFPDCAVTLPEPKPVDVATNVALFEPGERLVVSRCLLQQFAAIFGDSKLEAEPDRKGLKKRS